MDNGQEYFNYSVLNKTGMDIMVFNPHILANHY